MAGTLKVDLVQPADLEVGSQQLANITSYALGYVQQRGLPIPVTPASGFQGRMPPSLTALGDDELGDLVNDLSEGCAYVDGQLAIADSERQAAEADYDFRKARIRI